MPPPSENKPTRPIHEIVEELGLYPVEAFEFVQRGLAFTVHRLHGEEPKEPKGASARAAARKSRHVSGRDLSEGLRDFALLQWGFLARTVLARWNITRTEDFGRIVFAMVANGFMAATEEDTIEDFKNVFDFRTAFEEGYRIECRS